MKKIFFTITLVFLTTLIFAQNNSIIPIFQQTADYIKLIEEKHKQNVVRLEYNAIKNSNSTYIELFDSVQYGVLVFGDDNIKNLSLKISNLENNDWKNIVTQNGENGIIMFYKVFGKADLYKFEIITELKKNAKYGYYSLMVIQ